jgi:hypothetical protein
MYGAFGALIALSLLIALGLFYRVAIVLFFLLFTYVQLIDASYYLNHYYLVSTLAALMAVLPLHRAGSLDAWRKPSIRQSTLPAWVLHLLRFQVGVVYVFAGFAKIGGDWLLHGQPLGIWMAARTDLPGLGPLLDDPGIPLAMSWAGMLHDLLAVPLLLWPRTRPWFFAVLVVFHALTGVLFKIGMFPFIMIGAATILLAPDWPRRALNLRPVSSPRTEGAMPSSWRFRLGLVAGAVFCTLQVLMPLRSLAYPGDVLWNEQGMRWAWKVKLREKNGSVTYHVTDPDTGRSWQVSPRRYLTWNQEREMATRPAMIRQLAHHIDDQFRKRGLGDVEVRAEALVSLNGRKPQPLIDSSVDLSAVEADLGPDDWILPAPDGPPLPAPSERRRRASFTGGKETSP